MVAADEVICLQCCVQNEKYVCFPQNPCQLHTSTALSGTDRSFVDIALVSG